MAVDAASDDVVPDSGIAGHESALAADLESPPPEETLAAVPIPLRNWGTRAMVAVVVGRWGVRRRSPQRANFRLWRYGEEYRQRGACRGCCGLGGGDGGGLQGNESSGDNGGRRQCTCLRHL